MEIDICAKVIAKLKTLVGLNGDVTEMKEDVTTLQGDVTALGEQLDPTIISTDTLANIETQLITIGSTLTKNGQTKAIRFTISQATGLFVSGDYVGTIYRCDLEKYIVNVWNDEESNITGYYSSSPGWKWYSPSEQIANLSLAQTTETVDANTETRFVVYTTASSENHFPVTTAGYLITLVRAPETRLQFYMARNGHTLYHRYMYSDTWSDWKSLTFA